MEEENIQQDKPYQGINVSTSEIPKGRFEQQAQDALSRLRDKILLQNKYDPQSSMGQFVDKWGDKFAYSMMFIIILVNISLYVDVFVKDPKAILGVHLTRIILLLAVLIVSIISLAKGWKMQEIEHTVNILIKSLYLVIMLGYFIAMAVKLGSAKIKLGEDIFRLIVSIAMVIVGIVTFIGAITLMMKNETNQKAQISMYYLLVVSALGIILSVVSIIKAYSLNAGSSEQSSPTEPSPTEPSPSSSPTTSTEPSPSSSPTSPTESTPTTSPSSSPST